MRAWNEILDPKFIGSWDIPEGGTVVVKITKAEQEYVDNFKTNKKEKKLILYLDKFKPLVCNITNAKSISLALKTNDLDLWIGRYIEIYAKKIRAFGENKLALRVKDVAPPPPPKPKFEPSNERWEGAVKSIAENETTIEKMKKVFTLSPAHEEQMKEEAMSYIEEKQKYDNEKN